ncbi:MAG: pantoate--beta-alanine ligase, partial [Bdellovibrio sp.]
MRQFYRGRVGFVPTMGALHEGHAELLRRSQRENDLSILSIFVNPHQFNSPEDFANYPKSLDADLKVAAECRVDWVFTPEAQDLFPSDSNFHISESSRSLVMEGLHRPGHFRGMLGVVLRLLNLAQASH